MLNKLFKEIVNKINNYREAAIIEQKRITNRYGFEELTRVAKENNITVRVVETNSKKYAKFLLQTDLLGRMVTIESIPVDLETGEIPYRDNKSSYIHQYMWKVSNEQKPFNFEEVLQILNYNLDEKVQVARAK